MSRIKGDFQKGIIVFLLFTVLGLTVYWNALDNPYEGDDALYVTENVNIRSLKNIPAFFAKPRMLAADPSRAGHYRPLVVLSYAVNYAVGGLNPVIYHLTNLGFHILTAFLIFLILKAMLGGTGQKAEARRLKAEVRSKKREENTLPFKGRDRVGMGFSEDLAGFFAALAAGIIFLVHPFNSEAVNYITARSSVMSGFFYLLGFWCWIKYREQSAVSSQQSAVTAYRSPLTAYYYAGSLLAFVAGMLSKEVLITLPVMFWLYDVYGFGRGERVIENPQLFNWRGYISYLPFVLIVVIPYLVIRLYSYGGILPVTQRNIPTQIFTEAPVLVKYWRMFIIPSGLSLVHDTKINQFITGTVILSIGLLMLYIGTALYLLFRKGKYLKIISFFMFWFIIVLLPTTVISLNAVFQENRGYIAIAAFAIIAGIALKMLEIAKGRKVILTVTVLLILIYSFAAFYRNMTWDNMITLNSDAVNKAPNSALAYTWLAQSYINNGDGFLALKTAEKGLGVEPDNYSLRLHVASGYQYLNRNEEAIQAYKNVLSLSPVHGDVWNELGKLYLQKDDIVHAEICFREGIKYGGSFTPLYYNLGKILLKKKEYRNAIEMLDRYIKTEPENVEARYDKANALDALGMAADAEREYREIIRVGSSAKAPDKTVSNILEEAGKRLSGDKTIK